MVTALTHFAGHLARKVLLRYTLFLAAALAAIWISGYHFGTFDQVIHIPFIKKFADPGLYPGDAFLDLRNEHYSYFWLMFLPAYRAGVLEPVMFAVHFLTTWGLFAMFWELTSALFHNPLANLLSVCMLVFPHLGMPGFQIIEFSLLNRTFVLPFLLGAMVLYLRRKTLWAFLILGVMFNLHAIYSGFVLMMFLVDGAVRWREIGWKRILAGLALFGLAALPVFLWQSVGVPLDLTLRPDLLKLSGSALLAGVYYMFSTVPQIWLGTMHGAATLAFYLVARRMNVSPHERVITHFMLAIGLLLLVQLVTTYWLPVTLVLQLQILRIGVFLMIIGYIYFAGYLAAALQQGRLSGLAGGLVVFAYVTYVSPILPLVMLALNRWLARYPWRQWAGAVLLVCLHAVTLVFGLKSGFWSPGYFLYEPKTAWTEVQDWARENTPREAMFITPPHILMHYIPDWRTFSERGTLATLVEIFEFPHPGYLSYWQDRFETIAPGAIERFNGNYFDTFRFTRGAYYSLSPQDYLLAAQKYSCRYLVVEKSHVQPFPVVYQNEGFVVYDLQGLN